ncbi:MAG TPA: Hsp33 family molecular chaperone HslO [Polyangia bacterium]|jgi:molecular chaperone Hsp33
MTDEIVRTSLRGFPVRAVAVTTTEVTREAVRRHQAGQAGALALGRGLTAGLLLATLTKDEERVSLQVLGDGPLGGLTVDASSAGTARGYVKNPHVAMNVALPAASSAAAGRLSLAEVVGSAGVVSAVRDLGLRESFRGQTSLASGEIDEDVERYLLESEQIASALACDAVVAPDGTVMFAGGILLQALPGSDGAAIVAAASEGLRVGLARILATRPENAEEIIIAALGERFGEIQLLDRRPVSFHCPCSRARAATSLALLGNAELSQMILDDGKAEVTCNFCRARYQFDEAELETIRREISKSTAPAS